jgi:pilus assembly protein CpaC
MPTILDEGLVRLKVAPEVSSIDQGIAVTVFPGADAVPGISTRRVDTTVELREGQTLVLAGLLQVELNANTARIPGLGDLPYIGPMFSNTLHERVEKELLVLVTPYLVAPLEPDQVPCLPGSDLQDPNDLEFYLMNRIEGRRGRDFRTTTGWDDPWHLVPLFHLERDHACGPVGFSE